MTAADPGPGRILVIDGDERARGLLARSLRDLGHVVAEASDGAEALEWATTWPPDLVLLDRTLPDGDGLALLVRLKTEPLGTDVPVIVVTSGPERTFVEEALSRGAHDFLPKPFGPAEVLARTQSALRTKAVADELRQLAAQDPLTGLRNRRGLAEALCSWRAHCRRYRVPLTVARLDVEGFPPLADQHSDAIRDRVLRAVAEQLQSCVRAEDVVGRWGGDEFVVLLPRADAATARALLERVNGRLAGQQLLPDRAVTLRAGVAVAHDGEDDEHLLGRAAVALLQQRAPHVEHV